MPYHFQYEHFPQFPSIGMSIKELLAEISLLWGKCQAKME